MKYQLGIKNKKDIQENEEKVEAHIESPSLKNITMYILECKGLTNEELLNRYNISPKKEYGINDLPSNL